MSQRTVILTVPADDARAGTPRLLKDLLFDELLRRLEALERERRGVRELAHPLDPHPVVD